MSTAKDQPKKEMTVQEAGRLGGKKLAAARGPGYYRRIGKLGGLTTKKRHGTKHYQEIGKLGGDAAWDKKEQHERRKSAKD